MALNENEIWMVKKVDQKGKWIRDKTMKIGIIALLPDTLEGPWMGRHQILTRLAKNHKVIWLNQSISWRKFWVLTKSGSIEKKTGFKNHQSGIIVFNPGRWLPQVFKPLLLAKSLQLLKLTLALIKLKLLGCKKYVLYVTRPGLLPDIKLGFIDLICYHVFDDYTFSDTKIALDPQEKNILEKSDVVFFSSAIMLEEKGVYNKNSYLLPNGVDLSLYSKNYPIPFDLLNIPRPIVGYSGVIKKQLDLDLMYELAIHRPSWSFVFVGPVLNVKGYEKTVSKLNTLNNTYFLGKKPPNELPSYIKHFDVGLMCYVNNNYTKYISPLKLKEYMAAGINIVGTNIHPLIQYSNCLYLADTSKEWLSAIEKALCNDGENILKKQNASRTVKEYDWSKLTYTITSIIRKKLIDKQ